jgi:hypothetical protein
LKSKVDEYTEIEENLTVKSCSPKAEYPSAIVFHKCSIASHGCTIEEQSRRIYGVRRKFDAEGRICICTSTIDHETTVNTDKSGMHLGDDLDSGDDEEMMTDAEIGTSKMNKKSSLRENGEKFK